jgi:RNA polymerase sporulation-specific sigma factor
MNDYELLSYVSENNEEANEIIFEKYKPYIVDRANKLYVYCKNCGVEVNDLIQEGMVGLNNAIKTFNEVYDTLFYTYASKCINSRIISYIVKSGRLKNKILNESIFLELNDSDKSNGFGRDLADNSYNPEEILINEESKNEILKIINEQLNDFERDVIYLKINGFKYKEIADMMGRDVKYIDNCIQRIKNKIREKLIDKD